MNLKTVLSLVAVAGAFAAFGEEDGSVLTDNTFGVLKVSAPAVAAGTNQYEIIVSAPWAGIDSDGAETANDATNMLHLASLKDDDELFTYSATAGKYPAPWAVKDGAWVVATDAADLGADAPSAEMAVGGGAILRVKNAGSVAYVMGMVPKNVELSVTVPKGASLISYPWAGGAVVDLASVANWDEVAPDANDRIRFASSSNGELQTLSYNATEKKWGVKAGKAGWKYPTVPAGMGFWYLRSGDTPLTIAWVKPDAQE